MFTLLEELIMFTFNYVDGASLFSGWTIWGLVLGSLFLLNEGARRWKWAGFASFVILPIYLTYLWFTDLKNSTYTDWFHLIKVYSALVGCIGFWLIRYVNKKDKDGTVVWRLANKKLVLIFPPLILAINIMEAVVRDFQIGITYWMTSSGPISGEVTGVIGGPWNFINGVAGILNIIAITGWFGIVIKKRTERDRSSDMLWPDMLWFWIIAYNLWNFTYTYNCIPTHSWYAGFALLLSATICSFTVGKGGWLQHRAQTLAFWCMFAQTFPNFQDEGKYMVVSTYNQTIYMLWSIFALVFNLGVITYMVYKVIKTKRHPYKGELYVDHVEYEQMKKLSV